MPPLAPITKYTPPSQCTHPYITRQRLSLHPPPYCRRIALHKSLIHLRRGQQQPLPPRRNHTMHKYRCKCASRTAPKWCTNSRDPCAPHLCWCSRALWTAALRTWPFPQYGSGSRPRSVTSSATASATTPPTAALPLPDTGAPPIPLTSPPCAAY